MQPQHHRELRLATVMFHTVRMHVAAVCMRVSYAAVGATKQSAPFVAQTRQSCDSNAHTLCRQPIAKAVQDLHSCRHSKAITRLFATAAACAFCLPPAVLIMLLP